MPKDYWTGKSLLSCGLPWLTPGAIDALEKILNPQSKVVEFGSGGSTVFFSRRSASVLSWEPNSYWRKLVAAAIAPAKNVHITKHLENVFMLGPDFDLVLVDSHHGATNRFKIANRALKLVGPAGHFVLDNYGRYDTSFLEGWKCEKHDDPHWSGCGTLIATR